MYCIDTFSGLWTGQTHIVGRGNLGCILITNRIATDATSENRFAKQVTDLARLAARSLNGRIYVIIAGRSGESLSSNPQSHGEKAQRIHLLKLWQTEFRLLWTLSAMRRV